MERLLSYFSKLHILVIQQSCGRKKKSGKTNLTGPCTPKPEATTGILHSLCSIVGGFPLSPFQKHMAGFESLNGICQPSVNLQNCFCK